MKLWPPWKNRIKLGDLVRFDDAKRAKTRQAVSLTLIPHLNHIFEIGLVIDTQGLNPVVSFPSGNGLYCATASLEVI
jgi:hypothetical protein